MYIAMNRFKIARGMETKFEEIWRGRETFLEKVPGFKKFNLWSQDKGQQACPAAFIKSIGDGIPCIPADEIFEVARVTIEANDILLNQ